MKRKKERKKEREKERKKERKKEIKKERKKERTRNKKIKERKMDIFWISLYQASGRKKREKTWMKTSNMRKEEKMAWKG